ncbi:uncharacterized protein L969DRAFT_53118 [Mixia osmundae IAM 14324]|uniref:non-specific serine/threonine protein kinase n=1 Tax=Mixia osmundae (strain CBS 9802 / IAM 14324 / JCM 22182 / KY 12970) TaxID=764103 RepID=G7DUS2_MIXOS|nr:uncharacterized protein L969DRAFT_53118 [Mixia osmundae IAM 14324]KEI37450.1 hypothetical protein L969DRAFT_53118 [Mixia osmundae IAM 14324]GAA94332.1 hypothetical protein E5Q_00983 [Mixia osmundae IAM 14324]
MADLEKTASTGIPLGKRESHKTHHPEEGAGSKAGLDLATSPASSAAGDHRPGNAQTSSAVSSAVSEVDGSEKLAMSSAPIITHHAELGSKLQEAIKPIVPSTEAAQSGQVNGSSNHSSASSTPQLPESNSSNFLSATNLRKAGLSIGHGQHPHHQNLHQHLLKTPEKGMSSNATPGASVSASSDAGGSSVAADIPAARGPPPAPSATFARDADESVSPSRPVGTPRSASQAAQGDNVKAPVAARSQSANQSSAAVMAPPPPPSPRPPNDRQRSVFGKLFQGSDARREAAAHKSGAESGAESDSGFRLRRKSKSEAHHPPEASMAALEIRDSLAAEQGSAIANDHKAAPSKPALSRRESTSEKDKQALSRQPSTSKKSESKEGGVANTLKDLVDRHAPKMARKSSVTSKRSDDGKSDGESHYEGSRKGPASTTSLLKKYGVCEKVAIGKGATAVVRLAHKWDRTNERLYAVKEFRKRRKNETEKEYVKKLTSEFCISSTLHHANVVETVDLVQDEQQHWCEVMEYCPGGDLYGAIKKGNMSTPTINSYFKEMIHGINYLHSMGVAHRDIKPENLLLDAFGHVKITDFGVSDVFRMCWEKQTHMSKGLCGSEPYIAPEQFDNKEYDARLVDVWAAAVVFYCLVFQELPWRVARLSDPSYQSYVSAYAESPSPPPLGNVSPRECRSLVKHMLDPNIKTRYNTESVMNDEWFKSITILESRPIEK